MNTTQLQAALARIGWPIKDDGDFGTMTKAALWDFQAGYAFRALDVDGRPGPQSYAAIEECLAKDGRCSAHFRYAEFKSKGNGWIKISRVHAYRLDRYRDVVGPVRIVSGYRDPAHNRRVGGATSSRHMAGDACDIPGALTLDRMRGLRLFTGLGVASSGVVVHVDSRPGNPADPIVWRYG